MLVFDQVSVYLGLQKINISVTMMMSQISKSVDFTKTQKSTYLKNRTFLFQLKKIINYTSRATLLQKNDFAAEVTFK